RGSARADARMARGSAMDSARGRERSRGAQTYPREQAGRDPARSDDAGDGRLCGRCSLAEGGRLAGHPGHCHYLARSRRQRPRAIECRRAIRAGQGEVPAGRSGGAHPPVGAQQAPGQQRNGSSIVTKVLYVEDNDDNVFMLKMRLELLGDFEVLSEDGEKGCEMAAAERPDIILMDLEMPNVDGWEATPRLIGNPKTRDIPDTALSAHALSGEREKALAVGCNEFDTKPIEFDRLVATVRRILADRKLRAPERAS